MKKIDQLANELVSISRLGSALGLLGWDEEVYMPPKAQAFRAEVKGQLSAELHSRFTAKKFIDLVKNLKEVSIFNSLSDDQKVIVRETWRDLDRAIKLPTKFVEEFSIITSKAYGAWAEARGKADYSIFKPLLAKVVAMKIKEAQLIGYKDSPYDVLIDEYEPGMNTTRLNQLFKPLAKATADLVVAASAESWPRLAKAKYKIETQDKLNKAIATKLGFDFKAGRLDESVHPFTINFHPTDVRITTRYDESDFWVSLGSTIHETGHALYEQGLSPKHFGTPLGESVSLGVHESQSRIWENFVAKSYPFSKYLYSKLKVYFPSQTSHYSAKELWGWLNRVKPSLIRVESDEVTYNLHIILRFEIEKALVDGSITVDELPAIWNQKIKSYLNLKVPNDSMGLLQDIHWAHGTIGYFPTYTLGNLYAAQLFNKAKIDNEGLMDDFEKGDFRRFLEWLRKNIHRHGRTYQPEQLIKKATGEALNPRYLEEHLRQKVYKLKFGA